MGNIMLTFSNYLGMLLWLISIALRLTNNRYGRHVLAVMLLLGTLNVASFGIGNVSLSVGFGSAKSIGVNPILLLILIVYVFVNKTSVKKVVKMMFFPSAEEHQLEHKKQTDFYLRKFEKCSDAELEIIKGNFNLYPPAAQDAITELCKVRKNQEM